MPVCASIRCGNLLMPTSSARASASPTSRSRITTFHAGYARYFTPPVLVEAVPANIALFDNTTGAPPAGQANDPVLPERSHYFDAGIDQKIPFGCRSEADPDCTMLDLGVDAYYKIATDLLDNGTFGQALVLSAFNYAQGVVEGIEFSAKFKSSNFQAYANLAVGQEKATNVVSNQYLFDNTTPLARSRRLDRVPIHPEQLDLYGSHADRDRLGGRVLSILRPASEPGEIGNMWGAMGSWCGTKLTADMIYGSGLRSGDANTDHQAPYAQFNVGISRDFLLPGAAKPTTVRFDVVNLFDTVYQIRSGSGIGVFAPQYGPRLGFYAGVTQKF